MIHRRLHDELAQVASRYGRLRLWQGLAVAWLAVAAVGGVIWALSPMMQVSVRAGAPLLAAVGFVLAGIVLWRSLVMARNHLWVARQVELKYPELKTCLLAAIEQEAEAGSARFGYLQSHVIHEALDHARAKPWVDVVPRKRIAWAMASSACSLLLLVATVIGLATSASPKAAEAAIGKAARPNFEAGGLFDVTVEPGSTEVERGSSLPVLARIKGPIPAEASLTVRQTGQDPTTLAMTRSLEDPLFGYRIPDIRDPLDYTVETGGILKGPYRVDVFEYPRVEKADAELIYPAFTRLDPKVVQDVRTVTVVEGTKVVLTCNLNKPVTSATLMEGETAAFSLESVSGEKPAVRTTILADRSRKLALVLVDDRGRKNKISWNFTLNVVPNNPVTLKPVFPGRDMEVSPLEEMDLAATAWDDFGVERFGLSYSLAGKEPVEVVLGEHGKARHKNELAHRIELEKLAASPDDLLSYHWWAEDLDSSGAVRRVEGDMYFAEVRKFEEIFREGEAQARNQQQRQQQQSQNEQSAEQLAQLQKEIINATWKLIRREQPGRLTDKFPMDVEDVAQGQQSALEKAAALGEKVTDQKSMAFAEDAVKQMEEVVKQLTTAKETPDAAPLRPALAAAQSAYQNLLKLRAREHQVTQQQQSQSSSSRSQSRSQQQRQQLQQLDLKNQENPYESQRTASENPQETAEQREDRQALNRLRELARRQHDLNERLKELQAALEEAKTENEKEELRRQLKRLQEEQRQVVQDADELQSRMEQPENQERMAEQRQQLEQARDQAQRASEAIEQEMAGQAAASGTRAEQEFEDLREEFRRRSSNRFSEDVRQLTDAANELNEKQNEIAQQMGNEPKPGEEAGPKSLADDENKDQTAEELARQRQRLSAIQERMRKTIEEAEQDEPLLTKRLYDAVRDLQDQNVERALADTEQAIRRGFSDDAKKQERTAAEGIEKLNENMKSAAEAVLGDDTEALRRAREELQRLARELNDEIARNDPEGEPQDQAGRARRDGQAGTNPGEQASQQQGQGAERSSTPMIPGFNDPNSQPGPDSQPMPGQGDANREAQTRPGTGEPMNPEGQRPQQGPGGTRPQPSDEAPRLGGGRPMPGEPQEGQTPMPGGQPGEQSPMPSSESPMGQSGQQPGQQPGQQQQGQGQRGQQPGSGQPQSEAPQSSAPGQPGEGRGGQPGQEQAQDGQRQPGERQPNERNGRPRGPRSLEGPRPGGEFRPGGGFVDGDEFRGGEFNPEQARPRTAPITGDDFRNWSDRLRDVEEMVNDPELRAEAARIRERARGIRAEMRRHSEQPKWDVIRRQVAEPLLSLRDRVHDEVVRRASRQAVVPLDRDPVPPEYAEKTRAYYERLGTGR